jgi:hypothetical protein
MYACFSLTGFLTPVSRDQGDVISHATDNSGFIPVDTVMFKLSEMLQISYSLKFCNYEKYQVHPNYKSSQQLQIMQSVNSS